MLNIGTMVRVLPFDQIRENKNFIMNGNAIVYKKGYYGLSKESINRIAGSAVYSVSEIVERPDQFDGKFVNRDEVGYRLRIESGLKPFNLDNIVFLENMLETLEESQPIEAPDGDLFSMLVG